MIVLFPSMYNDATIVDEEYEQEKQVVDYLSIKSYLFNYDAFVYEGRPFRVNVLKSSITDEEKRDIVIYRGPALSTEYYQKLCSGLNKLGLKLINTRDEYRLTHEFYYAYKYLKGYTPSLVSFGLDDNINWRSIKSQYTKFKLYDYVKSVKGFNFPVCFDSTYSNVELDDYLARFKELRSEHLTGGILVRDFMELKKDADGNTNEYRCWFCNGSLIYKHRYTKYNGDENLDTSWLKTVPKLHSKFYTCDVGELKTGGWIVIGTEDGQVSELGNTSKVVLKNFYKNLKKGCLNNVK